MVIFYVTMDSSHFFTVLVYKDSLNVVLKFCTSANSSDQLSLQFHVSISALFVKLKVTKQKKISVTKGWHSHAWCGAGDSSCANIVCAYRAGYIFKNCIWQKENYKSVGLCSN